jgi:hypothetical protein
LYPTDKYAHSFDVMDSETDWLITGERRNV